jgi:signal peptidase II
VKKPLILGILTFILDQFTKYLIVKHVDYAAVINVISIFDFFNITNIYNTGTAFSILLGKNLLLSLIISFFLLVLSLWFCRNKAKFDNLQKYAFCLVIFGGFGNLTDRVFRGFVIDFLDFGVNSLRWPSFNVADSCICVAMFLIVIDLLFLDGRQKVR